MFLQAVPEAEALLIDLVTRALPKRAKSVADLFCGVGTLTFPLARLAAVTAYDSDKRAMAAMDAAVRRTQGLKPIDARQRDLFRDPLSVRELNGFDAVVFDPPRAGAAEQAERLAQSKVPVIIAVSCSPATLARDARTLIDGGVQHGSRDADRPVHLLAAPGGGGRVPALSLDGRRFTLGLMGSEAQV